MKVVIIDNYDSFTFNLYQYCGEILNKRTLSGQNEIIVKRNDEITVKNLENINPDKIIISPGPGSPDKKEYFGNCQDIIIKLGKWLASRFRNLVIIMGAWAMGVQAPVDVAL